MKKVKVNGETYAVRVLREEDIVPGTLVCGINVRGAYRLLMLDGNEWIMRNMRHDDLVDAVPAEWLLENCNKMMPMPSN